MPEIMIIPCIACLFILFDIISGVAQAVANHEIKSTKLREGLFHKMAFIFAMCLGFLIEFSMAYIDLGFSIPIGNAVCAYVILTEIVSISENIIKLNPTLAESKIMEILHSPKE